MHVFMLSILLEEEHLYKYFKTDLYKLNHVVSIINRSCGYEYVHIFDTV